MSPVQTGAPPVEEAPSPTRSLKWRAHRGPRPAQQVGDGRGRRARRVRVPGARRPAPHRRRPEGEGRRGVRAAEPRVPARNGRRRSEHGRAPRRRRAGLAAHRLLRRGDLSAHRRHRRHPRRLLRREDGHRSHAAHRLLPRDPRRPADDRHRGALRPEHVEHHRDHRDHLLDVHGPSHARPDEERTGAGLRSAGSRARCGQLAGSSCATCCPRSRRSSSRTPFC